MKNLVTRTITGVIYVVAIVVCFLNPLAMEFLFAIITGLTLWEFCGLVNEIRGVSVNRFISTIAGVYLFLAFGGYCGGLVNTAIVFVPYLLTIIYLFISGLYIKNENPLNDWAYTMLGQMYIALPFSTINILAFNFSPDGIIVFNYVVPLCVFIFLWANDSGAYCIGSLLGKHKLFERISPNKTWEGTIGGLILVLIAAGIIGYLNKDSQAMVGLNILQWLGLGIVVAVFGTWGDLVESTIKRTLGIKDSGNILPGHGGMLDRFDSSLMAIPASVIYIYT
ncbi:MAG: phosphatidate cytidylyltransferase, partial [Prevotella sp.]|nr:phosphatidate cytidylyltransferase [Prevotella sp.]